MSGRVEYQGYVIVATAEAWGAIGYAGSHTITKEATGKVVRVGKFVAFRRDPDLASEAAIEIAIQFIDQVLPLLLGPSGISPSGGPKKDGSDEK